MIKVSVSAKAERQLADIYRYTLDTWGPEQAAKYKHLLASRIASLARAPELGRPADHIRLGLRALLVQRHLVYYRIEGDRVLILAVLHTAQDAISHLGLTALDNDQDTSRGNR